MDEDKNLRPLSESQRRAAETATQKYARALHGTPQEAGLLARGLNTEVIRTARLGVVQIPEPGHSRFKNFLSIPYLDKNGEALTLRFRCMDDHKHRDYGHGKYMSISGDFARVYNIGAIHRATDTIHVTEGEFDSIILSMLGYPAIAIPGASGWAGHHRRMLAGFNRVYVWGDPDDAGAEFTNKVMRSLRQARGVPLVFGDINETYQQFGEAGIIDAITEADK